MAFSLASQRQGERTWTTQEKLLPRVSHRSWDSPRQAFSGGCLTLLFSLQEAIQHKSFFKSERKLECGNVDEAFKIVDQILEGEIHIGGQEHFYMETQSMLVVPKGEDGEIDIYVSTQFPKYIQDIVAATLKLSANKVMCHVRRVGGAFGGKVGKTSILAAITAFAASKHGRAVRCILERGEDMLITGGRHPYLGKYKVSRRMSQGRIHVAMRTFVKAEGNVWLH